MAYTLADLETIKAAIASGVRKVTYADGSSAEYRGLDEMIAVRDMIAGEVSPPPATGINRSVALVSFAGGGR